MTPNPTCGVNRRLILAAFAGIIVGSGVGWKLGGIHQGKIMLDAISLLKTIELHREWKRGLDAYAVQPRAIAIWELSQTIEALEDALRLGSEGPKMIHLNLFQTHARLARLLKLEGEVERAQEHFESAARIYNRCYPEAAFEDFQGMLDRIRQFDEQSGVKWD